MRWWKIYPSTSMAFGKLGVACRIHVPPHRPLLFCAIEVRHGSSVAAAQSASEQKSSRIEVDGSNKGPKWKFRSEELGISDFMISKPARHVLHGLRKKGYEAYLVGGCVRDLILKRTPKDFDIITSAQLTEVKKTFSRCIVVGKRFPICHVHVNDTTVEVSSFSTSGRRAKLKIKFDYEFKKPSSCGKQDYIRWKNCIQRDFTINSLMLDPFSKTVYDYLGAMRDIKDSRMRTIIPANLSFVDDSARILRAVRIAARLGFRFSKDMALSIRELASAVLRLDKGRILMEMNYMLAYGSAEASLRLLWRFGLLELLLPFQASYFVSQGFRRRDDKSNMLLALFSNLDKMVGPDQPCHSSLWVSLLAFHKALDDQPQDPLVVAAFSLCIHSGGSLFSAIEIAKSVCQPHERSFSELSDSWDQNSKSSLMDKVIDFAASVKDALCRITDSYYVSQAMKLYPQAPSSDLVFISPALFREASKIFECVRRGTKKGLVPRRQNEINHDSLTAGSLEEIRHVFARIVFDTVYPPNQDIDASRRKIASLHSVGR